MSIEIGTAPDAWGVWFPDDPQQTPWHRFLDEVAEVGYQWIELGPYGYLPTDPAILRPELERRNVKVCACVVEGNLEEESAWPDLERQILGGGELVAALEGRFLVLIDDAYFDLTTGAPSGPTRLDESAWKRLVDTTRKVAEIARSRFGLQLVFHANAETHVECEDQIERLLEETDPEMVGLCLDTGHHAYCGGDPVEFIRRHHQRLLHVHLKNINAEVLERVRAEKIPMPRAVALGVFCELGAGVVDFAAVRDALWEVEYDGFALVEQDMYPVPFDLPLQIARRSRAHLREIGLG
jgi:inosose dehydratase